MISLVMMELMLQDLEVAVLKGLMIFLEISLEVETLLAVDKDQTRDLICNTL